jgi:hypothetical protein
LAFFADEVVPLRNEVIPFFQKVVIALSPLPTTVYPSVELPKAVLAELHIETFFPAFDDVAGVLDVLFHVLNKLPGFLQFDLEVAYLALGGLEVVLKLPDAGLFAPAGQRESGICLRLSVATIRFWLAFH